MRRSTDTISRASWRGRRTRGPRSPALFAAWRLARRLFDDGVLASAVVYPAGMA